MPFRSGTAGAIQVISTSAAHLGQGIKYPLAFDAKGRLQMSAGQTAVEDALRSMLQTQPGERPMEPDYGADVYLFEPVDLARANYILARNIADHEPRIIAAEVSRGQIGQSVGEVQVSVTYTLAGEATPRTLTFPYFTGPSSVRADGT